MAAFKLPKLCISKKKTVDFSGLPTFAWKDVELLQEIGQGAYGKVIKVTHKGNISVVKKLNTENMDVEKNLVKECRLLYSVRDHRNISCFQGICLKPFALMMAYENFDFGHFGVAHTVTNLLQWLNFVHTFDDSSDIHDLFPVIAKDIVSGLGFLHERNIVHRDMKPQNVLVSNRHYMMLDPSTADFFSAYQENPIICKLTDFGESRSNIVATNTILCAATQNVQRGSLPYMPPEILLEERRIPSASIGDLKRIDVWALGMTLFNILNPDLKHPFEQESQAEGMKTAVLFQKMLEQKFKQGKHPEASPCYQLLQETKWVKIRALYLECTRQDPISRPKMEDLHDIVLHTASCSSLRESYQDEHEQRPTTSDAVKDKEKIMESSAAHCDSPSNLTKASDTQQDPDDDHTNTPWVHITIISDDSANEGFTHTSDEENLDPGTAEKTDRQKGRWSAVLGDFHQASVGIFRHDAVGSQCSTIAVMAALNAHVKSPLQWSVEDINGIVRKGDEAHVKALQAKGWPTHRQNPMLDLDEIPHTIQCMIDGRTMKASIGLATGDAAYGYDLSSVLSNALAKTPDKCFVLRQGDKCIALLKCPEGGYAIFDSHACDERGAQNPEGSACLIHFNTSDEMISHLGMLYKTQGQVDVTPVDVALLAEEPILDHTWSKRASQTSQSSKRKYDHITMIQGTKTSKKDDDCDHRIESSGSPQRHIDVTNARNVQQGQDQAPNVTCVHSTTSTHISSDCPVKDIGDQEEMASAEDLQSDNDEDGFRNSPPPITAYYNGDKDIPIYKSGKTERFTPTEAVKVILQSEEPKCKKPPLRVRQNYAFLIDLMNLNSSDDVKCDMNGSYPTVLRVGVWTVQVVGNSESQVNILHRKKVEIARSDEYHLSINSKMNDVGLVRSLYILYDSGGEIVHNCCLLQYHIAPHVGKEKVDFQVKRHGNRKHGEVPFFPLQKSVLDKIKQQVRDGGSSAHVYNQVSRSEGGILEVRHPGQLPRSRHQVYQVQSDLKVTDDTEELAFYARSKEEQIILKHEDIPEDLWVIGTEDMCFDMRRFCTSALASHPLSVDPTFEFGKFEVTPFTYRNLLLSHKRSKASPVFLGPTALHHSKNKDTYSKVVTTVLQTCPELREGIRGFITDGETALYDSLKEALPNATGLRCFRHFYGNCQQKLNKIGIRSKQDQAVFLDVVFGKHGCGGLVDAEDEDDLAKTIAAAKELLNHHEGRLLSKPTGYESRFWRYLHKRQNVMRDHMVCNKREQAGMPVGRDGVPVRAYTNQSESVNNILTRQKEAVTKANKKACPMTKLGFVKDVWEQVREHQKSENQLALCGLSEEYELAKDAAYLTISPDVWFSWTPDQRASYYSGFCKLTMEDVRNKKPIAQTSSSQERPRVVTKTKSFSMDVESALQGVVDLSHQVLKALIDEASVLLNLTGAVSEMPTLVHQPHKKFLVASKACKHGYYTCTVYKDHVNCECTCNRQKGICKHSLCVAERCGILVEHVRYVAKRRNQKGRCTSVQKPKDTAGKKGGQHKNHWRPRTPQADGSGQSQDTVCENEPKRPFTEIHHNNLPLVVCFVDEHPKATQCQQCGVEFPRFRILPYDIILSHQERWTYRLSDDPLTPRRSNKYTTKYYCVRATCVLQRFHYFTSDSFLEIPPHVKIRLHDSHKALLTRELNYTGW